MKLIIECDGDISESVSNYEMSVDFGDADISDNDRDEVRKSFSALFDDLGFIYSSASFHFEDECSECYTKLVNGNCKRCDEYYEGYRKKAMEAENDEITPHHEIPNEYYR